MLCWYIIRTFSVSSTKNANWVKQQEEFVVKTPGLSQRIRVRGSSTANLRPPVAAPPSQPAPVPGPRLLSSGWPFPPLDQKMVTEKVPNIVTFCSFSPGEKLTFSLPVSKFSKGASDCTKSVSSSLLDHVHGGRGEDLGKGRERA